MGSILWSGHAKVYDFPMALTDSIRKEFDLSPDYIFMNSGSSSIAPRVVRDEVKRLQDKAELNPTAALIYCWQEMWKAQKELAQFLHAQPGDLFLRNNISEAINNFVMGMPLPEGGEILYSDLEYGAVKNTCRFRAERDGLLLREFHASRNTDSAAEHVIKAIQPQTKMLVLSHVFTSNGLVLPIEEIARETRKRGVILVIDGAHAAGALPLDFQTLKDVDCYGGNLHKWIMGPKGSAFGWAHPMWQDRIVPLQAGWTTFEYLPEHSAFGDGSRFQGRFAPIGTIDFSSFLAIPEIMSFWQRWGAENIRQRIAGFQRVLEAELSLPLLSPHAGPGRGPLLAWKLPEKFSSMGHFFMRDLMEKEKLQIALPFLDGGRCLRLSPHIYNTEEEVRRAVKILNRALR